MLLVFGFTTGLAELITDWYHVAVFKSLVYDNFSLFRLWASPEYMPLGWMNTMVQMGYIGWRLSEFLSVGKTMAIVGIIGALSIPYYEEMAFHAGAWHYQNAYMIGNTPLWVFAAYLVEIPWVVPIVKKMQEKPFYFWILAGIIQGIIIFVGGFLTYSLLGFS